MKSERLLKLYNEYLNNVQRPERNDYFVELLECLLDEDFKINNGNTESSQVDLSGN